MNSIQYREVNPLDPAEVDAWVALVQDCDRQAISELPVTNATEAVMGLIRPGKSSRQVELIGKDGDRVVSAARIHMPLQDNRHRAEVDLMVHPDLRKQGLGTAMLQQVETRLSDYGRDTIHSHMPAHYDVAFPRDEAGERFARSHGFVWAVAEDQRTVDFAELDAAVLDDAFSKARSKAKDFELVTWVNEVPEDLIAGVARLEGRLLTESPTGTLSLEPEHYDHARIREAEHHLRLCGGVKFGVGARHIKDGRLAGFTEVFVKSPEEFDAWQGSTIVDRDFRGHRLGMTLKIANTRELRRYRPLLRRVHTWNAAENSHMIAINEALGYRLVSTWAAYEKKLE